jgi:leucyl aminopeptidase (aminopeptidase T)
VGVEGDREHVEFVENAIAGGGPDANHFGEIMIGLNPAATIRFDNMFAGIFLETERHAGVMHMAVGSSTDFQDEHGNFKPASVKAGIHLDCMSLRPTIKIDDQYSVKDGRLVFVDHPDVQALAAKHHVTL